MADAMQFNVAGGPDALRPVQIAAGKPGPGEVRLRQTAIGLNYIDVYHRSGLYPVQTPAIPGLEAAGVVEEVGAGVALKVGDRVAYGRGPLGAYATERLIAEKELIRVPEGVSNNVAASMMLKGLTAWYLLHQTYPVRKGETILMHAAAGGVGLILCQWASKLGVRVIGTVGSSEKAAIARAHGCDEIILYRSEDVATRVRGLTGGKGVPVVYDGVGKTSFIASLDALQPFGVMVSYGQASGPVPMLDLAELSKRGSLYITRPNLGDYMRDDATYRKAAEALLGSLAAGDIKATTAQTFALKEAAAAHRALENRGTTGSTILLP